MPLAYGTNWSTPFTTKIEPAFYSSCRTATIDEFSRAVGGDRKGGNEELAQRRASPGGGVGYCDESSGLTIGAGPKGLIRV